MERSGTLGNSYQLGSALKERQKLPAGKRASFVVPFCSSFRAGRFILYNYPGFRCASPWAEIFNRFAVGPTGSEKQVGLKNALAYDRYLDFDEPANLLPDRRGTNLQSLRRRRRSKNRQGRLQRSSKAG